MQISLEGKVAIVTGVSGDGQVGQAVAKALAENACSARRYFSGVRRFCCTRTAVTGVRSQTRQVVGPTGGGRGRRDRSSSG